MCLFFICQMFDELASKGHTRFSISIDDSCTQCYNVRLLKVSLSIHKSLSLRTFCRITVHSFYPRDII